MRNMTNRSGIVHCRTESGPPSSLASWRLRAWNKITPKSRLRLTVVSYCDDNAPYSELEIDHEYLEHRMNGKIFIQAASKFCWPAGILFDDHPWITPSASHVRRNRHGNS